MEPAMHRDSRQQTAEKKVVLRPTGKPTQNRYHPHQSNHHELDANRQVSEAQRVCDDSHGCGDALRSKTAGGGGETYDTAPAQASLANQFAKGEPTQPSPRGPDPNFPAKTAEGASGLWPLFVL